MFVEYLTHSHLIATQVLPQRPGKLPNWVPAILSLLRHGILVAGKVFQPYVYD